MRKCHKRLDFLRCPFVVRAGIDVRCRLGTDRFYAFFEWIVDKLFLYACQNINHSKALKRSIWESGARNFRGNVTCFPLGPNEVDYEHESTYFTSLIMIAYWHSQDDKQVGETCIINHRFLFILSKCEAAYRSPITTTTTTTRCFHLPWLRLSATVDQVLMYDSWS